MSDLQSELTKMIRALEQTADQQRALRCAKAMHRAINVCVGRQDFELAAELRDAACELLSPYLPRSKDGAL